MAVDVCSEIPSVVIISPRISFSYDINSQQADPDIEAAQNYIKGSDSESDFLFCIISPSKCLHEPCLADEIFANGKILPTQIKKKNSAGVVVEEKKIRLKELLESEVGDEEERKPAGSGKSFWRFRRSSSLNCDCESGRGAKGLIKSIQFLSRSKSTGSVPNPKPSRISRTRQKQNFLKTGNGNQSDKSQFHYALSSGHKPPLGRTISYGSGNVRIGSVLNIPLPPSYMCRGNASLFGFGSLLCTGKDKSKKKKAVG